MSWELGHEFDPQTYPIRRSDLVRYAGASGDFNPIHYSDRVAVSVGLPGVVAHGMYTLALVGRALTTWVEDPALVMTFGARFTRPVFVPDDDEGTTVDVTGVLKSVEEGRATIELTVTHRGKKVLGVSRAVVRC